MSRRLCSVLLLAATACAFALSMRGVARAAPERRVGLWAGIDGVPLELLSASDSLWVLTCDQRCAGEGRRSVGRVVRVDPRTGRTIKSAVIARPGAIAAGAGGVFATDFWRHRIRRLDRITLEQTASLKLVLPAQIASRSKYAAFLPNDVAAGQGDVWISTEWCSVARADQQLRRALAVVRLPCDAYQTMAFGAGSLWISESLAGLYRIDPAGNRVTARLRIGRSEARLVITRLLFEHDRVLAIAARTQDGHVTGANALARIDATNNRVLTVTQLPPGRLLAAFGAGSLWIGRVNGSTVERIDPATGRTAKHIRAHLGTTLAFGGGHLWTTDRNGTLRQLVRA